MAARETNGPAHRGRHRRRARASAAAALLLLSAAAATGARAAYLRNVPASILQPDGAPVPCLITGDEYFRWAHDGDGYPLTRDPASGRLVYADTREGGWRPTPWSPGADDPAALGLAPRPGAAPADARGLFDLMAKARRSGAARAPATGHVRNIVIFLRFAGETEFTDPIARYDELFNAGGAEANSLLGYYREVSRGQLRISTQFLPSSETTVVSFQDFHRRGYYQVRSSQNPEGYPANDTMVGYRRLHDLLARSATAIDATLPAGFESDGDGDGYVDNVCYIARGAPQGWADVLWPHQWSLLDGYLAYLNGKRVSTYNLQLEETLFLPSVGAGVLCHETFHSLGAPDLYRYETGSGTYSPVGAWDLMENTSNPPQHMLLFMKQRYGGWLDAIPRLFSSGTYALDPASSGDVRGYRISSPYSSREYFVVEYREVTASRFESGLPGSGLLVYRINTAVDGEGNAYGPPDEVYVYRPGGTLDENGEPDQAWLDEAAGRGGIGADTDPSPFLASGAPGGLDIRNVRIEGRQLLFDLNIIGPPACASELGDANADGAVDVLDLVAVVNDILREAPLGPAGRRCADLYADEEIDVFDLVRLVNRILDPDKGAAEPVSAIVVRAERSARGWRLRLPGAGVRALQCAWRDGAEAPTLSGAADGASLSWSRVDGTLRCVAWMPEGGALGAGEVVLDLPAGSSGVAPGSVPGSAPGLVPGSATGLVPGSAPRAGERPGEASGAGSLPELRLAGPSGEAIPFELRLEPGGPASPARSSIVGLRPNPARGEVRILLDRPVEGPVEMSIHDAAGRRVRSLVVEPADGTELRWDLRDAAGDPIPSGVFFVSEPGGAGRRLLVVR